MAGWGDLKTERFGIVMTPEEKQMLTILADERRVSMSTLMRNLIVEEAKRKDLLVTRLGSDFQGRLV